MKAPAHERAEQRRDVEAELDRLLPGAEVTPAALHHAMREAVLAPGKRLRPILTLTAGGVFGAPARPLLQAACAVEMVHAASLILDDLPCMDDARLRRGRPCCHLVYGESTAILAAFGLLNRAFGVLADLPAGLPPTVAAAAAAVLADAIGSRGLIAGQVVDLEAGDGSADLARLEFIHSHKTGRLFAAAADLGALLGGAQAHERATIELFARNLGLAYQIVDDLLDLEGDAASLGKDVGQDAGRATFVTVCGRDGARTLAAELFDHADRALAPLGRRSGPLLALAGEIRARVR